MEELYTFRPYDRETVDALAAEMLAEVHAYEAQKEA
jgi:predicted transcriptional regulator